MLKYHPDLVWRDIDTLIPYVRNTKKHPDAQVDKIAGSIAEFGFDQPIVIDGENVIIKGHGRYLASKKLKLSEVPVLVRTDLSASQVKAARIADNRTAQSEWDEDLLKLEFIDLQDMNFDLAMTGFDIKEVEGFLQEEREPIQEDEVPEISVETIAQPGDLWLLGEHRVICGDCEDPAVMSRLLDGRVPDACVSDPPYGINFDTDYTRFTIQRHKNNKHKPIQNDDQLFDPRPYLDYPSVVLFGANYFAEHLPMGTWLVWDKRFDNGKAWLSDAELAWMKGGTGVYIKSLTAQGFVRPDRNESVSHPTQKPIELMAWCIEKCKAGDLILDPYLGSGTTLLAAHKLNKVCFGTEIEPSYVDVIVSRYEKLTGEKAIRA